MKKHALRLIGGPAPELRVPADTLIEAVGALLKGAQRAARLFVEGESVRPGARPAWLEAACRIEVTGLASGSAVIAVEAPTLAEAVPDRFGPDRQASLFGEPGTPLDSSRTAVDCFGDVLAAVVSGDRSAERGGRGVHRPRHRGRRHVEPSAAANVRPRSRRRTAGRTGRNQRCVGHLRHLARGRDRRRAPHGIGGARVTTSRTFLLDTNVLLALVRGGALGAAIDERFGLRAAAQRPLICVVTRGEIKVLAQRNGGAAKELAALDEALAAFVTVDISHPRVIDACVELDLASQSHPDGARNVGKNDLGIAAAAKAAGATLLTTGKDFEHLLGALLDGFYIDPSSVGAGDDV